MFSLDNFLDDFLLGVPFLMMYEYTFVAGTNSSHRI